MPFSVCLNFSLVNLAAKPVQTPPEVPSEVVGPLLDVHWSSLLLRSALTQEKGYLPLLSRQIVLSSNLYCFPRLHDANVRLFDSEVTGYLILS